LLHFRTRISPPRSSAAYPSSMPVGTRVQLANVTAGWVPMVTAMGSFSPFASAFLCITCVCRPSTSRAATRWSSSTSIRWIEAFSTPSNREKTIAEVRYFPASFGKWCMIGRRERSGFCIGRGLHDLFPVDAKGNGERGPARGEVHDRTPSADVVEEQELVGGSRPLR